MNERYGLPYAYGMLVAGIEILILDIANNRLSDDDRRHEKVEYLTDLLKRAEAKSHE